MFSNHLKIAFRQLWKQKLYTLIKIALFLFILNGLVFALLGFEKDQEVVGASPFIEKELD